MKQTRIKLNNGINLIHYYLPATNSITASAMFNVGSANEAKAEYGMAHFLEHMIFEGSKNFQNVSKTHNLLESLGIVENAWTYKNMTNYWVKSPKKSFPKAIEILFDRIFYPLFKNESIAKEKGIVLEEIKMGDDDPWRATWDNLSENIWKDSNLAHKTIGYQNTVSKFEKAMIGNFHKKYYSIDNLTLWIGGDIKAEKIIPMVEKFKNLPKFDTPRFSQASSNPTKNIVFNKMDINLNYLILGLSGFDIKIANIEHLLVLNTLLGVGNASLLNENLRIKKPIVLAVESEVESFIDDGVLEVLQITDSSKLELALKITTDQIKKILNIDFSDDIFERSKNMVLADFVKLQESSESFGLSSSLYNIVRTELLAKRQIDFDQTIESIRTLTKDDLQRTFQNAVKNSKILVSLSGPDKKVTEKVKNVISNFKFK